MLTLKKIVKDYVSGNNVTHALKGISVNFRKNEFVSILGASGCGKTTTLNIIGGLDRYTSGDLIINGKSTKKYKDKDWNTYRNHSIGFIFQSYNLISHQTILKNVELALTISGVDRNERKQRAYKALETVGLAGMEKKKPNQLSGGQCQRVAIARALINNPEILLADEPTGALDSETSVQIMDLLKEVAKDRLVIMVTHNPELAEKYSTRIIKMSDGLLVHDSHPFNGKEKKVKETFKGKKKKSSMSVFTAAGLSMSNLFSKLRRTILVTIAGSIGIIGVSAVLAVSQGVKDYIGELQNDMLSSYPIGIAEESVDYTSLMTGLGNSNVGEKFEFDPKNPKVGVDSMINYLMTAYSDITKVKTNKINDEMLEFLDRIPSESLAVRLDNYGIDPTNSIFGLWRDDTYGEINPETQKPVGKDEYISFNGLTQRYIAELKTVAGFSKYATYVDLFTDFMKEIPDNKAYIQDQYEVIAGDKDIPLGKDDLILVVDDDVTLTDLLFAQTGMFGHDEFIDIALCAIAEQDRKDDEDYLAMNKDDQIEAIRDVRKNFKYRRDFSYNEILDRSFYYYPENYLYNDSGVVANDEVSISISFPILEENTNELLRFVSLKFQNYYGYNLLIGTTIYKDNGTYKTENIACLNPQHIDDSLIMVDESSLYGTWFAFDMSFIANVGTSGSFDQDDIMKNAVFTMNLGPSQIKELPDNSIIDNGKVYCPDFNYLVDPVPVVGFSYDAVRNNESILNYKSEHGRQLQIKSILKLKDSKNFGCLSRGLYFTKAFADQYMDDASSGKVTNAMKNHFNSPNFNTEYKAYVKYDYYDHKVKQYKTNGYASCLNGDLSSSFSDLFSSITGVNYLETNAVHLRSLSGLKTEELYSEENEDLYIGAEFYRAPKQISLYPKSFADKQVITDYLDTWDDVEGHDELAYTDTIQIIITVVTTLIDAVTTALVAFSALSLVVSCFMIAVITYISVVERIKEIGIIRSLGGRKGDVANLFIMETLFTGLFSGLFGIAITYLFQVIFNAALLAKFGIAIANFTPLTAIIMVLVSVTLSVVSGLIPSQSAARKDPVVALRSND